MLLIVLAGVWAVVLVPPYVRKRSARTSDSIVSFHQHLSTLSRTHGGEPVATRSAATGGVSPAARNSARQRRRDVLFLLGGAVVVTLLLAVALGGLAVWLHLGADALLGGYIYLLVQMRKTDALRSGKVSYLPARHIAAVREPAMVLRSSTGS